MSWLGRIFGGDRAKSPVPPPYVSLISGKTWRVECALALKRQLGRLGLRPKRTGTSLVLRCELEAPRQAEAARRLISLGVAFSAGPTSPSDVLGFLQDAGLLTETFTEISWSAPGIWHTRQVGVEVHPALPPTIDWDEQGTLTHTVGGYEIRTDPLWILVLTATQGHEGGIEEMAIAMKSGANYGPAEIRALAMRSDRKRESE